MNYDVVYDLYTKQGFGDAAKIARLQLSSFQKMVNQTAYYSITLVLCLFTQERKYFPYALRRQLGFKYASRLLLKIL